MCIGHLRLCARQLAEGGVDVALQARISPCRAIHAAKKGVCCVCLVFSIGTVAVSDKYASLLRGGGDQA